MDNTGPPPNHPLMIVLPAGPTKTPWLGLIAVLIGTFISTLNGKFSTFGLADIQGAIHAGFDEGAWIVTAQSTAQMFMALIAVWLGSTFGPPRVLLAAASAFSLISLITPFATDLPTLLLLQFAGGLASGCFVPLTLSFVLFNTAPKYWAYGVAVYALNLELSLNISASLEGWYLDHLSWKWLYWQSVPLAALMALCLQIGVHPFTAPLKWPRVDFYGLASGGVGLSLIYAALDQGNRLDWFNSGLIIGLLIAGMLLVGAFFVHESRTDHPIINLKALGGPLPGLLVLVTFVRLTVLSTAYLIPFYLGAVRGFRALQVGQTLLWVAAPQLLICVLAGALMRRLDARLIGVLGFVAIDISCFLVAFGLTPLWGTDQFVTSALLQAVGQSFALSGIIFYAVLNINPKDAITLGTALQVSRLMGGELGSAAVTTFARIREQVSSNLIGQHVRIGDGQVLGRLQLYSRATARADSNGSGTERGVGVLMSVIRRMATTQAVIDAFVFIGLVTAAAMLLLLLQRRAPYSSASPIPLSKPRGT